MAAGVALRRAVRSRARHACARSSSRSPAAWRSTSGAGRRRGRSRPSCRMPSRSRRASTRCLLAVTVRDAMTRALTRPPRGARARLRRGPQARGGRGAPADPARHRRRPACTTRCARCGARSSQLNTTSARCAPRCGATIAASAGDRVGGLARGLGQRLDGDDEALALLLPGARGRRARRRRARRRGRRSRCARGRAAPCPGTACRGRAGRGRGRTAGAGGRRARPADRRGGPRRPRGSARGGRRSRPPAAHRRRGRAARARAPGRSRPSRPARSASRVRRHAGSGARARRARP